MAVILRIVKNWHIFSDQLFFKSKHTSTKAGKQLNSFCILFVLYLHWQQKKTASTVTKLYWIFSEQSYSVKLNLIFYNIKPIYRVRDSNKNKCWSSSDHIIARFIKSSLFKFLLEICLSFTISDSCQTPYSKWLFNI